MTRKSSCSKYDSCRNSYCYIPLLIPCVLALSVIFLIGLDMSGLVDISIALISKMYGSFVLSIGIGIILGFLIHLVETK